LESNTNLDTLQDWLIFLHINKDVVQKISVGGSHFSPQGVVFDSMESLVKRNKLAGDNLNIPEVAPKAQAGK
jgi:hypothetical protein